MKKILSLLALVSFSAFATEINETQGRYKIVPDENNIGNCAEMLTIDLQGGTDGMRAAIELSKGRVVYATYMNFSKTEPVRVQNGLFYPVYLKHVNSLSEDDKITTYVYGPLKIKSRQKRQLDFSQFEQKRIVTVSDLRGEKIESLCSFVRVSKSVRGKID